MPKGRRRTANWTPGMSNAGTEPVRRRGRLAKKLGMAGAGNGITSTTPTGAATVADKILGDVNEFGIKVSPLQARGLKHMINVRLGIV